jgi:hypothetical protein
LGCHLQRLIAHVIELEGPIHADALMRRLARAHGLGRAGSKIQDRVTAFLPADATVVKFGDADWIWAAYTVPGTLVPFRRPQKDEGRPAHEIPIVELASLALEFQELELEDRLVQMSITMGLQRLRAPTRARLLEAIEYAS